MSNEDYALNVEAGTDIGNLCRHKGCKRRTFTLFCSTHTPESMTPEKRKAKIQEQIKDNLAAAAKLKRGPVKTIHERQRIPQLKGLSIMSEADTYYEDVKQKITAAMVQPNFPKAGEKWQHFKPHVGIVTVVGASWDSEVNEIRIHYTYGGCLLPWSRPLRMWHDRVLLDKSDPTSAKVPRFTRVP